MVPNRRSERKRAGTICVMSGSGRDDDISFLLLVWEGESWCLDNCDTSCNEKPPTGRPWRRRRSGESDATSWNLMVMNLW